MLKFGGNRVSNHAVEIELGSAYKIRGRHVRVRCQVVDDIYPDWPGQDLSKIAGMSFLKNKQLADPGLGEKGKIDILLGLSDVTSCLLSSICAPECFVEARESIFGWVVRGTQPENTFSNVVLKILQLMPGQMNFSRGYGSKKMCWTKYFPILKMKSTLWIISKIIL